MSIEDDIFLDALASLKIKLTKDMYIRANYPHTCSLCTECSSNKLGYKLRPKFRYIDNSYSEIVSPQQSNPYLFICKECYDELPDGEN